MVLQFFNSTSFPHHSKTTAMQYFPSNSHSVSLTCTCMLIIQTETLRYDWIVSRKHARHASFIKPKPLSLQQLRNVTNYNHDVIFICFLVYFSSQPHLTTSYHVTSVYLSNRPAIAFSQHPKWVITQVNPWKVWSIAFIK